MVHAVCAQTRLARFNILFGDDPGPAQGTPGASIWSFNPVCYSQATDISFNGSRYFPCTLNGRYLTLQQTKDGKGDTCMNLCAFPPSSPPLFFVLFFPLLSLEFWTRVRHDALSLVHF